MTPARLAQAPRFPRVNPDARLRYAVLDVCSFSAPACPSCGAWLSGGICSRCGYATRRPPGAYGHTPMGTRPSRSPLYAKTLNSRSDQ